MKMGKGKYQRRNGWGFIYIPANVAKDSSFPFKDKEDLLVVVMDGKLEIRKVGTE